MPPAPLALDVPVPGTGVDPFLLLAQVLARIDAMGGARRTKGAAVHRQDLRKLADWVDEGLGPVPGSDVEADPDDPFVDALRMNRVERILIPAVALGLFVLEGDRLVPHAGNVRSFFALPRASRLRLLAYHELAEVGDLGSLGLGEDLVGRARSHDQPLDYAAALARTFEEAQPRAPSTKGRPRRNPPHVPSFPRIPPTFSPRAAHNLAQGLATGRKLRLTFDPTPGWSKPIHLGGVPLGLKVERAGDVLLLESSHGATEKLPLRWITDVRVV